LVGWSRYALAWRLGLLDQRTGAGIDLCRATGCLVTDLSGQPLETGRGLIAAADAETHARLVAIVRPHLEAVL
jgi:hypothetical protein